MLKWLISLLWAQAPTQLVMKYSSHERTVGPNDVPEYKVVFEAEDDSSFTATGLLRYPYQDHFWLDIDSFDWIYDPQIEGVVAHSRGTEACYSPTFEAVGKCVDDAYCYCNCEYYNSEQYGKPIHTSIQQEYLSFTNNPPGNLRAIAYCRDPDCKLPGTTWEFENRNGCEYFEPQGFYVRALKVIR